MSQRLGSLFAGIGGFELAAKNVGISPIWSAEIDNHCQNVLASRFPETLKVGDVSEISFSELPEVDILTAGSPCQGFSVAGYQKGLADDRSGLFSYFVTAIEEMNPRFAVWENVPGALTSAKGEDFANVIAALVGAETPLRLPKHPKKKSTSRTSGIARGPNGVLTWRVLDARYFGVAQRRRRIFAVLDTRDRVDSRSLDILFPGMRKAVKDGWRPERVASCPSTGAWAAPLDIDSTPFSTDEAPDPVTVTLSEILQAPEEVDPKYFLSRKAKDGILRRASKRGKTLPPALDAALRGEPLPSPVVHDVARPLVARADGSCTADGLGNDVVPAVAGTLGGRSGDRGWSPDTDRMTFVPVQARPLLAHGLRGDAETETETLISTYGFSCKDSGTDAEEETAPTLRAMNHTNSHTNGGGQAAVAYGFYPTGGTHGVSATEEASPPLKLGSSGDAVRVAYGLNGTQDPVHLEEAALPLESRNGAHSSVVATAWNLHSDATLKRGEGGAAAIPTEVSRAVDSGTGSPGGNQGPTMIVEQAAVPQAVGNSQGTPTLEDVSPTLKAGGDLALGGHGQAVVTPYRKSRRAQSKTDHETWVPDEVSNTLNCHDVGDVRATDVVVEPRGVALRGRASGSTAELGESGVAHTIRASQGGGDKPHALTAYGVRRLTPTECERLQGFPDGHTAVDRAKDSHRYKQLGNAVAVPVAEWVLGRIARRLGK